MIADFHLNKYKATMIGSWTWEMSNLYRNCYAQRDAQSCSARRKTKQDK